MKTVKVMSRWIRKDSVPLALVAVLVLAALATALWIFGRNNEIPPPVKSKREASSGLTLTAAQWATLKIEPVKTISFDSLIATDGLVVPNDNTSVAVYSQFSGRVVNVYAQPGQVVRKGAPLASLIAVEAAQTKSDIAAASAAEATLLKQLELARLTERRQHDLFLAEAGAEKDWIQSKSDLAAAENSHRAAIAALAAVREKAHVLGDSGATQAGAAGQTTITAPIAGLIAQRQVAAGQFVNSLASGGSTPLFTVTDSRTVWVVANVSETQAAQLALGQPVKIYPLAFPDRAWQAHVEWIASSVDPASHRVAVRTEIANADGALKPQMTVVVKLLDKHPTEAIGIPRSAIMFDGTKAHCFVVTGERTLAPRELQLGRVESDLAEVKFGLKPGEQVVTRGTLFIDRASEDKGS